MATSMTVELSVVVPTYREAANIRELTDRVWAACTAAAVDAEIVIVDDNSSDGTDELCRELAVDRALRLIVRYGERGLATAVVEGMSQARGRVIVTMDADLSHPPERVPDLYAAVDRGDCDIAIGSRYVAGGGVEGRWGVFRLLNSKVATALARGLTPVKDPMSGFFAIRRDLVEAAPPLLPLGYKILLELLVKCPTARVKEVPIEFRDRKVGQSKLNLRQQLLYMQHLGRLYSYKLRHRRKR